jgi:hypothetical protein
MMVRALLFTAAVMLLALLLLDSRPGAERLVGPLAWECGFAAVMAVVPTVGLLLLAPRIRGAANPRRP